MDKLNKSANPHSEEKPKEEKISFPNKAIIKGGVVFAFVIALILYHWIFCDASIAGKVGFFLCFSIYNNRGYCSSDRGRTEGELHWLAQRVTSEPTGRLVPEAQEMVLNPAAPIHLLNLARGRRSFSGCW